MKKPKLTPALMWGVIIVIWLITIISYTVYMNLPNK